MSTTAAFSSKTARGRGEDFEYRPLSTGAVASVAFGLLSTLVFVAGRNSLEASLLLSPFPLIGLAMGVRSLARIRANPGQLSGGKAAIFGTALSAICLFGGTAFAGYVYATEVPPGYVRRAFADLKPDEIEQRGDVLIPPDVAQLDGQKVFIKGYMRPDSTPYRQNVREFLLVRDNNQCCFGDISTVKFYDQVAVAVSDKLRVDYHGGLYRMGGTLRVLPANAGQIGAGPTYILEADYAK